MRKVLFAIAVLTFSAICASAQTADEIIAKYVKTIGGMDKIQAVKTIVLEGEGSNGNLGQDMSPDATGQAFAVTEAG